jgi:Uma2 family endonuclease
VSHSRHGKAPGLAEQERLCSYFLAGTALVWLIDPRARTVSVYTNPEEVRTLTEADTLHGGDVLPGWALSVEHLFERLPAAHQPRRARRSRTR